MLTVRFHSYYSLIIRRSFMKDYNSHLSNSRCVTKLDRKDTIEKNAISVEFKIKLLISNKSDIANPICSIISHDIFFFNF